VITIGTGRIARSRSLSQNHYMCLDGWENLQNLGEEFLQAGVPGMIEHLVGGTLFHDLALIHKEDHDCACEDGGRMRVSRFVMFS